MERPNYRKGSIIFDDDTILQVEQRGGGGSGVGGETGLAAVNLKTGESTNAALAAKDETIAEQAATIETQAGTIEEQAATISDLEDEVAAKQAIIDAFPTIEALSVTANGTYAESGKAYSPVTVNVAADFLMRTLRCSWHNSKTSSIIVPDCSIHTAVHPSDGVKNTCDVAEVSTGANHTAYIAIDIASANGGYMQYPIYFDTASNTLVRVTSSQVAVAAGWQPYIHLTGSIIKFDANMPAAPSNETILTITIS